MVSTRIFAQTIGVNVVVGVLVYAIHFTQGGGEGSDFKGDNGEGTDLKYNPHFI